VNAIWQLSCNSPRFPPNVDTTTKWLEG
jgi:hypothetical protein